MLKIWTSISAGILILLTSGCKGKEPEAPTLTLREIMASTVAPNTDVLFNAVSSSVTPQGVEEKFPKTDAEWADLRKKAVALIDASDLIVTPGRLVAHRGAQAKNPLVQLSPEEIEALIGRERTSWIELTHNFQESLQPMLKAIDSKNPSALSESSVAIEMACEACHTKFWYPEK